MQTTTEPREGQEMQVREKRTAAQGEGTRPGPVFEPAVDIHETEREITVIADVPGAGPGDVEMDLRESVLTLSARIRPLEGGWRPLYREYETGGYLRQFRIGQQIDQAGIAAQLRDGVLTVTLPKAEHALPRRIEVKTG
ncbi:MAG TPA: Hsp20/alpha crystallin family protein [Gemmatimonadota bacterium]|jgi:HSP20 family protein